MSHNHDDGFGVFPEDLAEAVDRARVDNQVRCSSPDPAAYHSPDSQLLENSGKPISVYMPSRNGLKGTVVPRATRLGGSLGYNPHKGAGVVNIINIDDDGTGSTSFSLDLSQFSREQINNECGAKDYRQVLDIDDVRVEAANVFESLAKQASTAPSPPVRPTKTKQANKRQVPRGMPANTYVVPKSTTGGSQITPNQTTAKKPQALPFPVQYDTVGESAIHEPTEQVTFEIEGIGQLDIAYHCVSQDNDYLVLAYDTRYPSAVRFMPQKTEKMMLVDVHSLNSVFEVYSVGIRFSLDHLDVCVLLVNDERAKE